MFVNLTKAVNRMNEKAIEALRNGLEDSHWYSDDDEKTFEEMLSKSEAFDRVKTAFYESVYQSEFELRVSKILEAMK